MNDFDPKAELRGTIVGIREGLADVEAGHTVTLEEYRAEVIARRRDRDTHKQPPFISAVREALADLDAGDRGMLLEDYRGEIEAKRKARARP